MPNDHVPPPRRMANYCWFRIPRPVGGVPFPHFLGRGRDPSGRYRTDRVRQSAMPGMMTLSVALGEDGRARVDGREHPLPEGGATIHDANDAEDWFGAGTLGPAKPFEYLGFIFGGTHARRLVSDLRAAFPGPYRLDAQNATLRRLLALTQERTHQVTMPGSEGFLLVSEVLAMVLSAAESGVRTPQTRQLAAEAEVAMAAQPERDWTVGELAERSGVSREHLSRAFTQRYGVAPRRYLSELRIQKACARLRGTDLPIKNIMLDLGFSSHATFTRAFRRYTQTTPSAYRADRPV